MTTRRAWNRRLSRSYLGLGMLGVAATLAACSESAGNGLNVIVIVADDLGWSDVGFTGASDPRTPNLDALANDSLVFDNFYVSGACTPSRYSLMTGNYADRSRDHLNAGLVARNRVSGLREGEHTIAESLSRRGYATAAVGKWHLGHGQLPAHPPGSGAADSEFHPNHHGFDQFHGPLTGAIDYLSHWNHRGGFFDWWEGLVPYADGLSGVYATTAIRTRALDFIDEQGDRAFFLYLPFTAPHTSNAPDDPISKLQLPPEREEELRALFGHVSATDVKRRRYLAMVYLLDEAVGAIVTRLEAKGLRSRTLIWFLSDNGGNPAWGASNTPFRDGKASSYEGGVRVPAFLHVPGRPGDRVEQLAAHVDILPTTLRLLELPGPSGLDGLDFSEALLTGETAPRVLYRANQQSGDFLRDGPLKIVRSERAGAFELYDLSVDPSEATDLALRYPAELERLTGLWNSWYRPRVVVRGNRR